MKPRTTNSKGPLFLRSAETEALEEEVVADLPAELLRELPADHAAAQVAHEVAELIRRHRSARGSWRSTARRPPRRSGTPSSSRSRRRRSSSALPSLRAGSTPPNMKVAATRLTPGTFWISRVVGERHEPMMLTALRVTSRRGLRVSTKSVEVGEHALQRAEEEDAEGHGHHRAGRAHPGGAEVLEDEGQEFHGRRPRLSGAQCRAATTRSARGPRGDPPTSFVVDVRALS